MTTAAKCCNKHHMPVCWRDVREGSTIKTYCTTCGKYIGQRPVETGKRK